MLTRRLGVGSPLLVLLAVCALTTACESVPLLAPAGSTITLSSGITALPATGTAEIQAQVLENSGTPPHSGTEVAFTTTLGSILPATAETDASGRVTVRFVAGGSNGTATITASSGGASTGLTGSIKISVGTAAVGRVNVTATPASVSAFGGSATIAAGVLDVNGNVLVGAPVVFSTTAGTLSSAIVTTDANGTAATILTTSQQATVTASVGAQGSTTPPATGGGGAGGTTPTTPTSGGQASGSVTVLVTASPTLTITPPTTPPSEGLPAAFTFAVTNAQNGAVVRSVVVSWGDGTSQNLGGISASQVVNHVYSTKGTYSVSATVTDSLNVVNTVSTSVTVVPVASPTINITASVPSSCTTTGDCPVTFLIQVTPPTGVGIVRATVNYGDAPITTVQDDLGGLSGSVSKTHLYKNVHGVTVTVTVFVEDTLGHTTQGFTTVNLP